MRLRTQKFEPKLQLNLPDGQLSARANHTTSARMQQTEYSPPAAGGHASRPAELRPWVHNWGVPKVPHLGHNLLWGRGGTPDGAHCSAHTHPASEEGSSAGGASFGNSRGLDGHRGKLQRGWLSDGRMPRGRAASSSAPSARDACELAQEDLYREHHREGRRVASCRE